MIPNGTRFIGISPDVDLKERKSAVLNKTTEPFTIEEIKGYKVYTALLTQSGESVWLDQTNGTFSIGVSYNIDIYIAGDDFSNIGGPASGVNGQWDGYWFVATGTTPLNYTNGSLTQWNTGAPVATVLENTIGNIWFDYKDIGSYGIFSDSLFTLSKTWIGNASIDDQGKAIYIRGNFDIDRLSIESFLTPDYSDDILSNTPIEIRVYIK